jgi:Raf kinase inhibitor-like YbhB/YbcL family protein
MQITSSSFDNDQTIPERYAFGIPDVESHMVLGQNRNPALAWKDVPDGTRSLVLMCIDPDAPSIADDVNQEGRTISANLPRAEFCHWVMVDIAPEETSIAEGACSDGVTKGGKNAPNGPAGSRQGINGYTSFLAGDTNMRGDYFGYDGPCPPWNDEIVHHYQFILHATDLEHCLVDGAFTASDVKQAIKGHVLATARIVGTYTLNPEQTNRS